MNGPVEPYPFSEPVGLDLDPAYAAARENRPVCPVQLPFGKPGWLVTGYHEARTVLSDRRFSAAAAKGDDVPRIAPNGERDDSLMSMDPPRHTRIRKLLGEALTARRVVALRPHIQKVVDELLNGFEERGAPADVVNDLALPMSIRIIADLLGVPIDAQPMFRAWTEEALSVGPENAERAIAATAKLADYVAGMVRERRAHPQEDLLSALVVAKDDRGLLSEQELVHLGMLLLVAGHETVANQISNFTFLLLTRPGDWQRLHADPTPLRQVIEELLRVVPLTSSAHFVRVAVEDVELGGQVVRVGEGAVVSLAAANRDPAVFENPDTVDFGRSANLHIGFGIGPHYCIGASLAREEFLISLSTLIRRFPTLRTAVDPAEVVYRRGTLIRGLTTLPVTW